MPWMIVKKEDEWCVYKKDSDGKPTGKTKGCHPTKKKAEAQQRALYHFVHESVEEHVGMRTIGAVARPLSIMESEGDEPSLTFQGCVLIDEVLSRAGQKRYYSMEFNDRCMEATNLYLAANGIITIYSSHGKVAGESGRALYPTGLPVGRVVKPLWRQGKEILYEAMISNTTEGSDVMTLIRDKVLQNTSLRASRYSSRMRALEDATLVEEMISAVIVGIDLCDQAGIDGAGIRRVLEEAPQWMNTEEDDPMDFTELTLEELVENRQDLLDTHTTPLLEAKDEEIATLADANAALKTQLAAAAAPSPDVGRLAILEASSCGLSKIMADKLTAMGVGTAEAIAPVLESVRAASLQELIADAPPAVPATPATPVLESVVGVTNIPDTDASGAPPAEPQVDPEQTRILELAQGRRTRRT